MGGTQIACQTIALVVLSDAVLVPLHRTACSIPESKPAQKMVSNSAVQSVCQEDKTIRKRSARHCVSALAGAQHRMRPEMGGVQC